MESFSTHLGSTVAHFYACSELNYYQTIGWLNLVVFFINCSSVFAFCCNSKVGQKSSDTFISRFLRLGSVAGGYIYGHIPLVYRLYSSGIDEAMFYHIISTLCLTTAAIIYAVDFPQRWYIGKFDIIGQSHQIFHILSAFCCYFDILAVEQDVLNRERYWGVLSQQADMLSLWHVCIAAVLLTISCMVYASNRLINHRDRIGHC
uniref:Uncharacterized protein n=1 Tax=Ciona savignyi TaxID=51511 RepID=H2YAJ0_CIOSA